MKIIEYIIKIFQIIVNFLSIPLAIFNIYVLIKCLNGDISLLTLSGIINLIDFIFTGGKALFFLIFLSIFTIIKTSNFWIGLCYALLIENTIVSVYGLITMLLSAIGIITNKNEN